MKIHTSVALAAILLAVPTLAPAQTAGSTGTNQATPMQQAPAGTPAGVNAAPLSDKDFVTAAATANRFEIQEAELALAQADDAKLKEFARMMVADHSTALKDLEAAARDAGIALPAEPALDQAHATKLAALKARRGADFDKAYRTDQVQARQEAVTLLETYKRSGAKEPLRAWAGKTLPVVKKHLEAITSMNMR
jgi:putative membrane protein